MHMALSLKALESMLTLHHPRFTSTGIPLPSLMFRGKGPYLLRSVLLGAIDSIEVDEFGSTP